MRLVPLSARALPRVPLPRLVILHRFAGPSRVDLDDAVDERSPFTGYTRGPGHSCTPINNDSRPVPHDSAPLNHHQHRPGSMLECLCWCGELTVEVTPRDLLNGRTLSCGLRDCTPAWDERAERKRARERRLGLRYKHPRVEIAWQIHYDRVKAEQDAMRC